MRTFIQLKAHYHATLYRNLNSSFLLIDNFLIENNTNIALEIKVVSLKVSAISLQLFSSFRAGTHTHTQREREREREREIHTRSDKKTISASVTTAGVQLK